MVILTVLLIISAFLQTQCFLIQRESFAGARHNPIQHAPLFSSRSENDNDNRGDGAEALDAMRKLLETSWDADTMGRVPSDATAAANEAFAGISSGSENGLNIFFVDLLLPSYDITFGTNMYDEVLAVEYCIALSSCLKGKTSILVRDERTLRTVGRILEARESQKLEMMEEDDDEDDYYDDDDEDDDDDDDAGLSDSGISDKDLPDDDISGPSSPSAPPPASAPPATTDVDAFRQQLISGWDSDSSDSVLDDTTKDPGSIGYKPEEAKPKPQKRKKVGNIPLKRYRLASLFGDDLISSDSNMVQDVIQAVQSNALPSDDEETIIILSAVSREEVVAVRSLVGKYAGTKRIVLVNSKIDPLPKELATGVTVYSVLPLLAQPIGENPEGRDHPRANVVVLRRYPRDWEVYVDLGTGTGFELAGTRDVKREKRTGPAKEWIAECVKKHMKSNKFK